MRSALTTVLAAAAAIMLMAAPATAKGPTAARISGLDGGPIAVGGAAGSGEPGSSELLGRMAEQAGVWAVGFGSGAGTLADDPPSGALGPKLRLRWTVPGPDGDSSLVQDLYPWAEGGPVTYTAGGQDYLGASTARGWHNGGDALAATLIEAGVPEQAPSSGPPAWVSAGAAAAAVVLAVAVAALAGMTARRRRRATATVEALAQR